MRYQLPWVLFLSLLFISCAGGGPPKPKSVYAPPAELSAENLVEFRLLPPEKKLLLQSALGLVTEYGWLKYQFGSADPLQGGMDCSGAMFHLLREFDYEVPRTSAQQYLWLEKESGIQKDLEKVQPGDLVFWSGTYVPTDGRKINITHVGLYLGREVKDGKQVMVCSSKGRSYRGRKRNGYSVFDFKPGARFAGFASLPVR